MQGSLVFVICLLVSVCIARPQFSATFHARVGATLTSGSNVWTGAGLYALDLENGFARADFTLFSTSSSSSVLNIHTLNRYDIGHAYVIDSVNYKCQANRVFGELAHPLQWMANASFAGESEVSGVAVENWEYKNGNEYHKVSVKKGTNEPVVFTERIKVLNGSESELVLTVREWSTEASPKWARYVPNFCNNENVGDANAVVYFANNNWNCADVACDSTVPYNSPQPDYACAEFVSRCLAYGGFIPNLGATDPQGSYSGYSYNGNSYSLINTEGLSPCLGALGFTKLPAAYSSVDACVATIGDGGDGYFSHAVIGVAPQTVDAHNWAVNNLAVNYDLPGGVDAAWGCPGTPPPSSGSYYSTQFEASLVEGGNVDNKAANNEKIVVEKTGSEIHFIEEKAAQKNSLCNKNKL